MASETNIGKIVTEKSAVAQGLHYVTCPLCGEDRPEPVLTTRDYYNNLPGEFAVVRCGACGFSYTNPRPFGERLAAYYPDSAGYYDREALPTADKLREGLTIPKVRRRLRQLGYLGGVPPVSTLGLSAKVLKDGVPPWVPNGSLLEVGSSSGAFLYQMQALGWKCQGIELNRTAAEYSRAKLGLNVSVSTLEEAALPKAGFDAIVMRMVVEHLPSPAEALAKLHQALRPGGWLVFSVPNFGAPERLVFGRYTYFLHVPQHLSHFTPDTVRDVLKRTAFTPDRICLLRSSRDFWGSVENRKHDLGEKDQWVRLGRLKLVRRIVNGLWAAYVWLNGNASYMIVYAKN